MTASETFNICYLDVIKNRYISFSGRATRREFWMFVLINMLVTMGLGIIESMLGLEIREGSTRTGVLSSLYSLAVFLPGLGLTFRRLHDTGRSGWALLWNLLPIIGQIILIVFYATDSQGNVNKYGPNPKAPAAPAPTPTPSA